MATRLAVQVLVAEPDEDPAQRKLAQFFRDGQEHSGGHWRLWLPADADLPPGNPWRPLAQPGVMLRRPLAHPSLLVLSRAADWQAARTWYGQNGLPPRLQLLFGADARDWGHHAARQPAIRVAVGDDVADALSLQQRFREPLQCLPMALDGTSLPPPAFPRSLPVLILARERPQLGEALELALRDRGIASRCERHPWPEQRWLEALATAVVVVLLPGNGTRTGLGQRRLAAMALGAVVVSTPRDGAEALIRDGENGLVRPPDAGILAATVADLLEPAQLQRRDSLLAGGRACLLRHGRALERLRFLELLEAWPQAWEEAQRCHAEAIGRLNS